MSSNFDLTFVDDVLLENIANNEEFYEFSNIMTELTSLTNMEIYTERVKDETPNLRKIGSDIRKNTWETTKDVGHAYGNIVSANANVLKASWDIVSRSINLASRALGYIINKISNIPKFILKVADRAADLPGEIKSKIRGDITLCITAKDLEVIYNQLLISRLTEYIGLASSLSKGEFWSTMTHKRTSSDNKSHLLIGENDMKTCRKMDAVYEHLKNTEFKPTIIPMRDDTAVNVYFGDSKSIKFTDNYGKKHECTYYEALNILIKDLNDKKKELEEVQSAIGDKLSRTEANQNYNKLDGHAKYRISTTISQIAKVVTIVGNFVKYVITDLNTINKSVDKILNKTTSLSNIDGKKAAETPADKVNTKL